MQIKYYKNHESILIITNGNGKDSYMLNFFSFSRLLYSEVGYVTNCNH